MDYTVVKAERGLDALHLVEENKFDLILMDLFMPGIDGYETSKEVRKLDKNVIILALSSTDLGVSEGKMTEAGINGFLNKPFSVDELNKKLKELGYSNESVVNNEVIKEVIFDITKGKDEFRLKLISLYIDNITELEEQFKRGILEKDYERLNFITHKVKTTIKMLKLETLSEFISGSITSLENDELNQDRFLTEFSNICSEIIDQLTKLKDG